LDKAQCELITLKLLAEWRLSGKMEVQKSPNRSGFFVKKLQLIAKKRQLLDFSFFEHHVLTDFGIKFFDLHFFRHSAFVLCGCVEIASASSGHKTNLIAHDVTPLPAA
jgi:hypothetical protein